MKKKITVWVARDKDGTLNCYNKKPTGKFSCIWETDFDTHYFNIKDYFKIEDSYNLITWEDEEPTKVELTIKICK